MQGNPLVLLVTESPTATGALTAPLLWRSPGMGPLGHPIHLPLVPGVRGSRPCLAVLAAPAGPCGSSQTVLAPLANRAHRVAPGDQAALVDPRREGGDDGLSTSLHTPPAGQAPTRTHPQSLQVTSEARALHVYEGLRDRHKDDVRHRQPRSGHPVAQGCIPHLSGLMGNPTSPKIPVSQGHPPACHAWRRVLEVLAGQVVRGVPLAPHLGHPGSEERVWFARTAKLMVRGRGSSGVCCTPTLALTFSPFRPGSPGVPGNPCGPISPCKGERCEVSRWQGKGVAGTPPQHPHHHHLRVFHPLQDHPKDGKEGEVSV